MAIETKDKEIGELHFVVEQLPYFAAQRIFTKLCKLAGAQLVSMATFLGAGGTPMALAALRAMGPEQIAALLGPFFEKLDPDVAESLTKEILQTTRVWYAAKEGEQQQLVKLVGGGNKDRGVMDAVIGGDFWTGLAVQGFALSVFFGNFSSARGALGSLGQTPTPSSSPESGTSTDGKAGS